MSGVGEFSTHVAHRVTQCTSGPIAECYDLGNRFTKVRTSMSAGLGVLAPVRSAAVFAELRLHRMFVGASESIRDFPEYPATFGIRF